MLITPTTIADIKILTPRRYEDTRGYFSEVYNSRTLAQSGLAFHPLQENQSMSRQPGTVRGLHFQRPPHPQSKLVRVLRGAIFDVAVDIRHGSPTFGRWVGAELTADGGEQIFIPAGFAHGFCTLQPDTEISYLVDGFYSAECDSAIRWNDPSLDITWPEFAGAVLSDKDASAPLLAERGADFHWSPAA